MKADINNNLDQKFSQPMIWIHWITALLITILVLSSLKVGGFDSIERGSVIKLHLILGSLVFVLTVIRSFYLFREKQPDNLKTGSKFMDRLIEWNHIFFYFLLFAISVMGFVVVIDGHYIQGLLNGMESISPQHEISMLKYHVLATLFIVLLALMHVMGVIKHLVFTRENTLKRIF